MTERVNRSVDEEQGGAPTKSKLRAWLEKLGVGAFLFFFIKGLIWLAIFFGAFEFLKGC